MAFTANMTGISRTRALGTLSAYHVAMTPFFQKIYVDDPANIFFNRKHHGEPCYYTHASIGLTEEYNVIFDDPKVSVNVGADAAFNTMRPQFQICEAVLLQPVTKQDRVFIRGIGYYIEDYVSDGVGITTAFLRLK